MLQSAQAIMILTLCVCVCVCLCVSGTQAWLLLLPGSLLPWSLALHAPGLLGCQLRPLSGGQVKSTPVKHTRRSSETQAKREEESRG